MSRHDIWFSADLHFGHEKIISLCNRPFSSVTEMSEGLLDRWNEKVKPNDEAWIIGDFAWDKKTDHKSYLDRMNGRKHLILGSHEPKKGFSFYLNEGWASIEPYSIITLRKETFHLSHWPIWSWEGKKAGSYHLYGHVHNEALDEKPNVDRSMDVGVDTHPNLQPYHIDEVFALLKDNWTKNK